MSILLLNIFKSHVTNRDIELGGHQLSDIVGKDDRVLHLLLVWMIWRKIDQFHVILPLTNGVEEAGNESMRLVPGP